MLSFGQKKGTRPHEVLWNIKKITFQKYFPASAKIASPGVPWRDIPVVPQEYLSSPVLWPYSPAALDSCDYACSSHPFLYSKELYAVHITNPNIAVIV